MKSQSRQTIHLDRIKKLLAKGFSFSQAIHLDEIMLKGYSYEEAKGILTKIERLAGESITAQVNNVPEKKNA